MKYKIVLDNRKNILDKLPEEIDAKSPQKAAEIYLGKKVKREKRNGTIVIQSTVWPYAMYIYVEVSIQTKKG